MDNKKKYVANTLTSWVIRTKPQSSNENSNTNQTTGGNSQPLPGPIAFSLKEGSTFSKLPDSSQEITKVVKQNSDVLSDDTKICAELSQAKKEVNLSAKNQEEIIKTQLEDYEKIESKYEKIDQTQQTPLGGKRFSRKRQIVSSDDDDSQASQLSKTKRNILEDDVKRSYEFKNSDDNTRRLSGEITESSEDRKLISIPNSNVSLVVKGYENITDVSERKPKGRSKKKKEQIDSVETQFEKKQRHTTKKSKEKSSQEMSQSTERNLTDTEKQSSLQNIRVVFTGIFDSCSREEMIDHVKRHGGICPSAVSGVTDILVTGKILEDGKAVEEGSKYRKAKELQKKGGRHNKVIRIVSEKEFLDMYPLNMPTPDHITPNLITPNLITPDFQVHTSASQTDSVSRVLGTDRSHISLDMNELENKNYGDLWTEKFRPRHLTDFVGCSDVVSKLTSWLNEWKSYLNASSSSPTQLSSTRTLSPGMISKNFSRAALISGPPGVGKTSLVRTLADEHGFKLIEFNASDDRGKSFVDVISDMTSGANTLILSNKSSALNMTLLLMDEVDGLSAGDRGGIQAIIKLIEKARCPIVCICNDRYNPKIKSLATKCANFAFHKPNRNVIVKRMSSLLQRENVQSEPNAIELLCEKVGNDFRQILNTLQWMSKSKKIITYDLMKQEVNRGVKDRQVMDTMFDACRRLLTSSESRQMSYSEKLFAYFTDYNMVPLYMQENYLNAYMGSTAIKQGVIPKLEALKKVASIADCFTFSDMMNRKCRRDGAWSLLGDIGMFSTVIPATQASGFVAFPDFPKWLGKNSMTQKNKRLLHELHFIIAPQCTVSPSAMQTSGYTQTLYSHIVKCLLDDSETPQNAAENALNRLNEYGLSKDYLTEHLHILKFKAEKISYDNVPTAVKRALTSKASTNNQSGMPAIISRAKKGLRVGTTPMVGNESEDQPEDVAPIKERFAFDDSQEQEDEQDAYLDRFIKANMGKRKVATQGKTGERKAAPQKRTKKATPISTRFRL